MQKMKKKDKQLEKILKVCLNIVSNANDIDKLAKRYQKIII